MAHGLPWLLNSISRSSSVITVFSPKGEVRGPSTSTIYPPPVSLGHFFFSLSRNTPLKYNKRLCVPGLGILHRLVPGWFLHGLCPSLHHHHPLETRGVPSKVGAGKVALKRLDDGQGISHGWGSSEARGALLSKRILRRRVFEDPWLHFRNGQSPCVLDLQSLTSRSS